MPKVQVPHMFPRAHFHKNMENKALFKNVMPSKLAWYTTASSVTQVGNKVNKMCKGKACVLFIGHSRRETGYLENNALRHPY